MSLVASISSFWCSFQEQLFPTIEEDLGPLGGTLRVIHQRPRVRPGGTTSAVFWEPERTPTTGPCGARACLYRQPTDKCLSVIFPQLRTSRL